MGPRHHGNGPQVQPEAGKRSAETGHRLHRPTDGAAADQSQTGTGLLVTDQDVSQRTFLHNKSLIFRVIRLSSESLQTHKEDLDGFLC